MEFVDRNEILKILDKAIASNGGWKHLGADKLLKEVRSEIEGVKTYLIYDEKKGMCGNPNKMAECFDRILAAIRCKDFCVIATYEREICEVMKIAMGNAKIESEETNGKNDD